MGEDVAVAVVDVKFSVVLVNRAILFWKKVKMCWYVKERKCSDHFVEGYDTKSWTYYVEDEKEWWGGNVVPEPARSIPVSSSGRSGGVFNYTYAGSAKFQKFRLNIVWLITLGSVCSNYVIEYRMVEKWFNEITAVFINWAISLEGTRRNVSSAHNTNFINLYHTCSDWQSAVHTHTYLPHHQTYSVTRLTY